VPPRSCEAVRILRFLFRAIRTAFEFEHAHGAGVVQQYVAHSSKAVCCSRLMHPGIARSAQCAPTAKPSAYKKLPIVTFSYGSTMSPFCMSQKATGAPLRLLLEVFNLGDVDDAVKVFACVWWVVSRPRQLVPCIHTAIASQLSNGVHPKVRCKLHPPEGLGRRRANISGRPRTANRRNVKSIQLE
jgi:hypothetical protein